jgi:hypothetical protein
MSSTILLPPRAQHNFRESVTVFIACQVVETEKRKQAGTQSLNFVKPGVNFVNTASSTKTPAAGDYAVEEELRGFADAEDAHARVHRTDLREHEGRAAEVVDDVALAELAHGARRVLWEAALAHARLLVFALHDRTNKRHHHQGQRLLGHALLRPVLGVVISRAFFLFFPCNHIINIKKKFFFRRSKRQRIF